MTDLLFKDEAYAIVGAAMEVYNQIELKAIDRLTGKDMAQLLNYLKATGLRLGLLVNFGNSERLEWERRIK
jgi:hypothetical protein